MKTGENGVDMGFRSPYCYDHNGIYKETLIYDLWGIIILSSTPRVVYKSSQFVTRSSSLNNPLSRKQLRDHKVTHVLVRPVGEMTRDAGPDGDVEETPTYVPSDISTYLDIQEEK